MQKIRSILFNRTTDGDKLLQRGRALPSTYIDDEVKPIAGFIAIRTKTPTGDTLKYININDISSIEIEL